MVRVLVLFLSSVYVAGKSHFFSTPPLHPIYPFPILNVLDVTMTSASTVILSPRQTISFLTLRTKLIGWIDKNPKSGDEAGKNGKPPVSKRREQVRRAQK